MFAVGGLGFQKHWFFNVCFLLLEAWALQFGGLSPLDSLYVSILYTEDSLSVLVLYTEESMSLQLGGLSFLYRLSGLIMYIK